MFVGFACVVEAGPCLSKSVNQIENPVDDDSSIVHSDLLAFSHKHITEQQIRAEKSEDLDASVLADSNLRNNQHNHDHNQLLRQRTWGQFIENQSPLPVAVFGWVLYHIITGKGENQ